jgi:hypothetical protein
MKTLLTQRDAQKWLMAAVCWSLITHCCSSRPAISEFKNYSLDHKIVSFENAYRDGCLRESENVYLGIISDHGAAAADAMLPLIRSPRQDFPVRAAIIVLGFVNAAGFDLRSHPVHEALRELASNAHDAKLREKAAATLAEIDRYGRRN